MCACVYVCVVMSLWTTYIYYWKWILYESTYQRQRDQRRFNKLPTVWRKPELSCRAFSVGFLHFGLWAKRLTLKASICSHNVIFYSFNLLVCKPCSGKCPSGWQVLIYFFFQTMSVLYATSAICSFHLPLDRFHRFKTEGIRGAFTSFAHTACM